MEEAAQGTGKGVNWHKRRQLGKVQRPPEPHKKVPPPVDTLKAREVWGLGMRHQ